MASSASARASNLLLLVALGFFSASMVEAHFPAMYVFGDSTADVGNNNFLPGNPATKSNYPHYGIDFPGGKPTGRFSNGFIAVDFLAQKSEMDESPPAVLSVKNELEDLRGLNFASAGSGILDTTNKQTSLSMNTQIKYFDRAVKRLVVRNGTEAAEHFLSRSLFVVSTASNDLFLFGKYTPTAGGDVAAAEQLVSVIAEKLKTQLKRIYKLGARKFAVFGTEPLGCAPALRSQTTTGGCVGWLNDMSRRFNDVMKRKLHGLSLKYKDFNYSYVNVYDMSVAIGAEPLKFGFTDTTNACCGSGRFNGATPCQPNATVCSNRDQFATYDWLHATQAAYKLIADWAYNGTNAAFTEPINIKTLVHQ